MSFSSISIHSDFSKFSFFDHFSQNVLCTCDEVPFHPEVTFLPIFNWKYFKVKGGRNLFLLSWLCKAIYISFLNLKTNFQDYFILAILCFLAAKLCMFPIYLNHLSWNAHLEGASFKTTCYYIKYKFRSVG